MKRVYTTAIRNRDGWQREIAGDVILIAIVFLNTIVAAGKQDARWYIPGLIATLIFCGKSHLWVSREQRNDENAGQNLRLFSVMEEDSAEKSDDAGSE